MSTSDKKGMQKKYTCDSIQTVSSREHVRMRPKLYFEKCFSECSLDVLPFEVLCHAFDEYFDGNCKQIELLFDANSFSVKYDTGMSLEEKEEGLTYAEVILTELMACSNLKKHLAVGQEFCNLGMATINFAAERLELTTVWKDRKGVFLFEKGQLVSKQIVDFKENKSCTKIVVAPDKEIFKTLQFTTEGVKKKAEKIQQRLSELDLWVKAKTKG